MFQLHYPDTGFELFRIVANYFKPLRKTILHVEVSVEASFYAY